MLSYVDEIDGLIVHLKFTLFFKGFHELSQAESIQIHRLWYLGTMAHRNPPSVFNQARPTALVAAILGAG
jgi:hypothetical protein